jgi:hypothetical protein
MAVLIIRCPKCRGNMWEEDLPDSSSKIDLVCIICGLRKFFDKNKYLAKRAEIEQTRTRSRRVVSTR